MTSLLRWVFSNLWSIPIGVFLASATAITAFTTVNGGPILLASVNASLRKDIYSSLTGSSSGLLGFCLAAVAILAAFTPRRGNTSTSRHYERNMANARSDIAKCLLTTSLFLIFILVSSTIGIGVDSSPAGNLIISSIATSAGFASVTGILISGAGVTLSILERGQG